MQINIHWNQLICSFKVNVNMSVNVYLCKDNKDGSSSEK